MPFANARGRRLLAIMPHPDDESYSVGGTLAMAADAGATVQLVCATRGERGWVRGRRDLHPAEIADLRSKELANACSILGLPPPRFLDWPDGGIDELGDDRRRQELAAVVGELAPDVIATLAADGVYGHRDHVALTRTCLGLAGPHRLLLATFPVGLFAPLAREMSRVAPELLVDGVAAEALGTAEPDLVLDIGPASARKLAAIASHQSQLASRAPLTFLLPGLVEAVSQREWFVHASGPPILDGSPFSGLP